MAITPFNLPLVITKGITFSGVIFYFKDSNGDPFDLTGWSAVAHGRRTKDAVYKIDLAPTITDAVNGEAQIPQFTDEQTLALTGGEYGWDFVLIDPAGARIGPFFAGSLAVKEVYSHV